MRSVLMMMALAGCVDPDVGRDRDNDGFQTWELGGDDCDDSNAAVNPSASEACGNGIDDDCDGFIDDEGIGQVEWYLDEDGDGFPSPEPHVGCSPPEGSFADLTRGVDCNDREAASFPGNAETYYDGIDGDCLEGDDFDADGDGYPSSEHGGDDCDDAEVAVNPGSVEICNNGIDDDCDGGPGDCEYRGEYDLEDVALAAGPYIPTSVDVFGVHRAGTAVIAMTTPHSLGGVEVLEVSLAAMQSGQLPTARGVLPAGVVSFVPRVNAEGDFNGDAVADPVIWDEDGLAVWLSGEVGRGFRVLTADGAGALTHVAVFRADGEPDRLAVFSTGAYADGPGSMLIDPGAGSGPAMLAAVSQQTFPAGIVSGGPPVIHAGESTVLPEFLRSSSLLSVMEGAGVYGPFPDLFRSSRSEADFVAPNAALILPWANAIHLGPGEQLFWTAGLPRFYPSLSVGDVPYAVRVTLDDWTVAFNPLPSLYVLEERESDEIGPIGGPSCFMDINHDGTLDMARLVEVGSTLVEPVASTVEVFYDVLNVPGDALPSAEFHTNSRASFLWCRPEWDLIAVSTTTSLSVVEARGL